MTGYGLTFEAIQAAVAALAVMLACTALGSVVGGGKQRLPGADTVVGLGLAGGILTVLAVATRVPISLGVDLLGMAGIAALGWSAWQRRLPGGLGLTAALLVASPLLAYAALGPATLWDDFAQWLPNAAYVFQYDSLPRPDLPANTASRHPGYPHILPFIVASASWLTGRFLESAGPVANVVLLASAGAAIADLRPRADHNDLPRRLAVAAATIGAFWLLFFPDLSRNVLFSSYADTATIAAVGVLGLLGVSLLERLDEAAEAQALAWRFGLAAAALVNLKQANLVVLVLLSLGLLLAAWRSGQLQWPRLLRLLPAMIGPAAVVFLVWRYYLKNNLPGGEMAFQPPALWNWDAVPEMARSLGYELGQNPPFHLLMWAVSLAGLWKLRHPRHPEELLAVATAMVWIGYNAFLIAVYLGAMTKEEAQIAADYWRYTPHVGMLAVGAVLIGMRRLAWPAPLVRQSRPLLLGIAALLPLVLLAAGPHRLSALAKVWPIQARAVAHELADILPPNSRLAPVIAFDYGFSYYAIGHDLHRFGRDGRNLEICCWWKGPITLAMFQSGEATHLFISDHLGDINALTAPLGIPTVVNESALYEWTGTGFHKTHSWPFPRATPAK